MNTALWILGIIFGLGGVYVIIMNWLVFVNNAILRKPWVSAVPLIGGVMAAISMVLLPVESLWKWAWICVVVDWGSLPLIVWSIVGPRERR